LVKEDEVKRITVYVLMLDHEMQSLQHCLGVFTTFERLIEAQSKVTLPTTLYETYFEYNDDYPPVEYEFAIVETVIIGNVTAVIRATNLAGSYTGTRQMSFVDPDDEYISEYLKCIGANLKELEEAFGFVKEEQFDLGDDNMAELRSLL
jgi:hypothetical protein